MQNSAPKQLRLTVLITLLICLFIPSNIKAQFKEGEEREKPKYAPGEVLVGLKEGADPQAVLQEVGLEVENVQRVHSVKSAVTKFKKDWKLERDSNGWYWFLGKKYQEVEEVSDGEAFQEAYKLMSPEEKSLYDSYKITLPEGTSVEQAVAELENNSDVEYAQPNYLMELHMVPNDPYYHTSKTWGQPYDDLWGLKPGKLTCQWAWNISQGEGVTVAVIDTGVDYNHEDLAGNIWINQAELHGSAGFDDDGNGYVDDIRGWDFSGDVLSYPPIPDNEPTDYYGHGTHCAGIIAVVGNNSKGVIGVAPGAKVMPLKMFPNSYIDVAAQAVKYAADNGARILSCSWGTVFRTPSIPMLETAIDYAYSHHCVVIFSAGNNNDDVAYYSPANYSKTIAVAATDHNDVKTDFSNWGNKIDIAAPGGDSGNMSATSSGEHYYVNILSLRASNTDLYWGAPNYTPGEFIVGDYYYRASGTSMSCAHVSGVAALIIGQDLSRTPLDVKRILFASADDKGEQGFDKYYGFGRVNAYKALIANYISYISARIRVPEPNRQFYRLVTISGTAIARYFSHYTIEIGEGEEPTTWTSFGVSLSNGGTTEVVDGILGTWDSSSLFCGIYTLRLRVFDTSGLSREHRATIFINNFIQEGWPQQTEEGYSFYLDSPVIVDIDNDGDLEIIASAWEGEVYAWHHDGTSVEGWPVFIGEYAMTPAVGDLDGDGYKEVVVGTSDFGRDEKLFVLQHDGTPYPGDWPKGYGEEYGWEIEGVSTAPTLADLDNDGLLEIIVCGDDGKLHSWHEDGTVVSGWPVSVEHSLYTTTPAVADIDNDGKSEVVVAEQCGIFGETDGSIYAWNDDGTPVSGNWPVDVKGSMNPPVIGDVDGDDQLEIVVNAQAGLFAFESDGTIMPGWPKDLELGELKLGAPSLGDLDGDGTPEVIIAAMGIPFYFFGSGLPESGVWVFKGDGTTFGNWPHEFGFQDFTITCGALVANVDVDVDTEVVVSAYDAIDEKSYLYIFEKNGTLLSGYPKLFEIEPFSISALGDLDEDGDVELADFGDWKWGIPTPFYVYDLPGYCDDRKMEWPMFHHDPQHTGLYVSTKESHPPIYELSLKDGDIVSEDVYVSMTYGGKPVPRFLFIVDGEYVWHNPWRTQYFSNGEHTVYGQYSSGGEWHKTPPITVIINNATSYVPEIISPTGGSVVSGNVNVTFETKASSAYFAFLYANDKIVGWEVLYGKQPPHDIQWRTAKLPDGPCDLKVVVYYFLAGAVSSESVRVTVNNTTIPPPTIYLTYPNPATGVINIHISSDDNIEFVSPIVFINGKFIGVRWNMPCDIPCDTTQFPNGSHNLHFRAYHYPSQKWIKLDKIIEIQN